MLYDHGFIHEFIPFLHPYTLMLITSLMISARLVDSSGYIYRASASLISKMKSPPSIVAIIAVFSGILASFIMNDAALFIAIPLILSVSRYAGIDKYKAAAIVTAGVNVGSALTPIGNPQNLIIWTHYEIPILEFIKAIFPFVASSLLAIAGYSYITLRKSNAWRKPPPPIVTNKTHLLGGGIILAGTLILTHIGYPGAVLPLAIMISLLINYRVIINLDFTLIATFLFMFASLTKLSLIIPQDIMTPLLKTPLTTYLLGISLSQALSNVLTTLILIPHTKLWKPLLMGVNAGGCGLVTASLANLITLRLLRKGLRRLQIEMLIPFLIIMLTGLFTLYY